MEPSTATLSIVGSTNDGPDDVADDEDLEAEEDHPPEVAPQLGLGPRHPPEQLAGVATEGADRAHDQDGNTHGLDYPGDVAHCLLVGHGDTVPLLNLDLGQHEDSESTPGSLMRGHRCSPGAGVARSETRGRSRLPG